MSDISARDIISDHIESLRIRAERYRRLAANLFDRRTSAEVVNFAQELEAEIVRLKRVHEEPAKVPSMIAAEQANWH